MSNKKRHSKLTGTKKGNVAIQAKDTKIVEATDKEDNFEVTNLISEYE